MKLFTTESCPKCKILKSKLDEKRFEYEESDDIQQIIDLGFRTVPVLEIYGEYMDFGKAVKWIQDM